MTDKEAQAIAYMRSKQWSQATRLLDTLVAGCVARDRTVALLWRRSQCHLELQKLDAAVKDCRHVVKLTSDKDDNGVGLPARHMLLTTLMRINKYNEALHACEEWLASLYKPPDNSEADLALRRLLALLHAPGGTRKVVRSVVNTIEDSLQAWVKNCAHIEDVGKVNSNLVNDKGMLSNSTSTKLPPPPGPVPETKKEDRMPSPPSRPPSMEVKSTSPYLCTFCSLEFKDPVSLRAHCQSSQHQAAIMSDEECAWRWRLPPRGFTAETYTLCESFIVNNYCRYGAQCVEAHGNDELAEWRERFEYRKKKLERATEIDNKGKSFTEQILEKWLQANSPDQVMKEKIVEVEDSCSNALITTVSSKSSEREWMFSFHTTHALRAVALLQDAHRNHFYIKEITLGDAKLRKNLKNKILKMDNSEFLNSSQEWTCQLDYKISPNKSNILEHRVKIGFKTEIYGTFRQSAVFDFGGEPALVKHLCVDVVPVEEVDKIKELCKEMTISVEERWDPANANIVPFMSTVYPNLATPHAPGDGTREQHLLTKYPAPKSDTFSLSQSTVTEKHLTLENYKTRMHELLYIEELARLEQVARYNITCLLRVAPSYLLAPSGMAASTAKYAHSGELFALLTLRKDVSEDTSAGRLILNNCTTALIAAPGSTQTPPTVYEALIEDKGKNMVYLRLPSVAVSGLGIVADTDYHAEVQFQLNRLTFCEWHYAIDRISDLQLIFPSLLPEPQIPWSPDRQWSESLDPKMNSKQKEAVVAITTPIDRPLPPILLIGPYGTGKTFTLAQAIKQLLHQPESRILICTHSNSAADLYIKDYLHPWLEAGLKEAKPLRIYYHKRWVATVNQVVQKVTEATAEANKPSPSPAWPPIDAAVITPGSPLDASAIDLGEEWDYCLIETVNGARSFRLPTVDDILAYRIIVVTLSISMTLSTLGLPKGFFTHILLDEAAQAMESEALMPLALATPHSRIVLAGDHMQLSPEIFSKFASERNLHISLLERLYDYYPPVFSCKILLCENYRAHQAIVDFTSELFYEQKLVASGRQPKHDKFYPLTFFTTRGEDIQDNNSTAFYNNSEVYELVERICEMKRQWPASWGKLDENSIGVMTPYADQVFRIRSELRKRRMGGISVERVLNVQGKEFRAVFLSTVRTRRTCTQTQADYGFLSDHKLLNTAITRARSLVAVVGDPVALCSVGRCRKLWERFIQICNENQSLFGVTWALLRSQLDGVELKKTFVLNPLAPEFIPRAARAEMFQQTHFPVSTQQMPVYYFPTLTTIVPNPATKITTFVAPPRRPPPPDGFTIRPPFLGPFSSSTPNGVFAPARPPQDISFPPPKPSPDPNFTILRPSTDEPFGVTRAPLVGSFGPMRELASVPLPSPKVNPNEVFNSSLVKPEGTYLPVRTTTDISTTIFRSIPELTYHHTNGDLTFATHTQRNALDEHMVLLKPNMMHTSPRPTPDRIASLLRPANETQLTALNTAVDLQRRNYHNFNAMDPRVHDMPNDIIPMPNAKALATTSTHFSMPPPQVRSARPEHEREHIEFLQNVHFPEQVLLPMKVQENKNFAPNINQMFSEESHECGWNESRGGSSVPLYARGSRRAPPPPPDLPPPAPDPHHLYFQYFR